MWVRTLSNDARGRGERPSVGQIGINYIRKDSKHGFGGLSGLNRTCASPPVSFIVIDRRSKGHPRGNSLDKRKCRFLPLINTDLANEAGDGASHHTLAAAIDGVADRVVMFDHEDRLRPLRSGANASLHMGHLKSKFTTPENHS